MLHVQKYFIGHIGSYVRLSYLHRCALGYVTYVKSHDILLTYLNLNNENMCEENTQAGLAFVRNRTKTVEKNIYEHTKDKLF